MRHNCKISFKSVVCIYNIYTHSIVFNTKKSTRAYMVLTKLSILAFIPTYNTGQNCPFWHVKVKDSRSLKHVLRTNIQIQFFVSVSVML
jgi:hypothetical protein